MNKKTKSMKMIHKQLSLTATQRVLVITLTLCLAFGMATPIGVAAQNGPEPIPNGYYGDVTIDGDPAPADLEITAELEGETYGPILTNSDGSFGGGTPLEDKLQVDPNEIPDDPEVTFFINGDNIDRTEVAQTDPSPIVWGNDDDQVNHKVSLAFVINDELPNIDTGINTESEQQLEEGLSASVLVENIGGTSTGAPTTLNVSFEGSPHETDSDVDNTSTYSINELSPDENQSIDISSNLTDWAQTNQIVGDVSITAKADPENNIEESLTSQNNDTTGIDVSYVDLSAEAVTRDSAVEGANVTLRSFIKNNGTADATSRDVNVTVANGENESYEFTIEELGGDQQEADRRKKQFTTAGDYTMTVEINETDTDIFTDSYTATSQFTIENYNLSLRGADEMRVPEELRTDSTSVATFFYQTNASEPINASIELPDQITTPENKNKTIDSSTGNNTVSWRINASETTVSDVELNVSVEDTLGVGESDTVTVNTSVPRETTRVRDTANVVLSASENSSTTTLNVSNRDTFQQNLTFSLQGGSEGRTLRGLEYLVRYPYGCVEQTTSSFLGALNTKQYYEDREDYDIDDDRLERINGSIEEGISRLDSEGKRQQLEDGGWNGWGRENADSETFYTAYALFGISSVQEDADYDVSDYGEGNIDFTGAVTALEEDQKDDGSFPPYYYFRDDQSITGFAMITLNQTVQSGEATSSDTASIQANASEYLVDEQLDSGAWENHDTDWHDAEPSATSTALAIWGLEAALNNDEIDWTEYDTTEGEVESAIEGGHKWLIENQKTAEDVENGDASEGFQGSWGEAGYHGSSWWSRAGDTSEEAAFATYALDETNSTVGDVSVENRTTRNALDNSTEFLTSVYEDGGSWGYTRATTFAIGALQQVTGEFSSDVTVEISWTHEGEKTTEQLNISRSNPETETVIDSMDNETAQALRNATTDDGTVNLTVERTDIQEEDDYTNVVIIAAENEQTIAAEEGGS